jgi:hypothetical protein
MVTPPPTESALTAQCGKIWPEPAFRVAMPYLRALSGEIVNNLDHAFDSNTSVKSIRSDYLSKVMSRYVLHVDICLRLGYKVKNLAHRGTHSGCDLKCGASAVLPGGFATRAGAAPGIMLTGITTGPWGASTGLG